MPSFLYEPGRRAAQRCGLCARRWKLNALHEDIPFPTAPIVLYDPTGSENRAIK